MLSLLRIRNLAIIEALDLELAGGMNVITGETGAGKSVLLRAFDLLSGRKASADLVRHGASTCELEAVFELSSRDRVQLERILDESEREGFFDESGEIVIRRTIDSSGKGRFFVNGRVMPAQLVQRIAPALIDITGQHDQQSLFDIRAHRELLDRFGGLQSLVERVAASFARYSECRAQLAALRSRGEADAQTVRRIEFELEELRELGLAPGERVELESRLNILGRADALRELIAKALAVLGDGEGNVSDQLQLLSGALRNASAQDASLTELHDRLGRVEDEVATLALELQRYASRLDVDPDEIERSRARLSQIAKFERKYHRAGDELIQYQVGLEEELFRLTGGAHNEQELAMQLAQFDAELTVEEGKLTTERQNAAKKLTPLVEAELARLNMPKARFVVQIYPTERNRWGADRIEFALAANPGSEPLSLARVASGGELSRLLLVLKAILQEQSGASLQIFDEIDAGIGGAVAQTVGEKLQQVSKHSQVLLVTHAPQIAALADHHFVVRKISTDVATHAEVAEISHGERVHEIARMLAGKKISAEFEDSARALLSLRDAELESERDRNRGSKRKSRVSNA